MKPKEVKEEIEKLKGYAEILGTPDEFFRQMNGHITELSLVSSAFSIANESESILSALDKQNAKVPNSIKSIEFMGSIRAQFKNGTCPCCNYAVDTDDDFKYCSECGQRLQWQIGI